MAKSNDKGAKDNKVDPRQAKFLELYFDPKSETFSNALQSAIRAGYDEKYAKNLLNKMPDWLVEKVDRQQRIVEKAERALEEFTDLEVLVDAMGPFGPIIDKETKKPYQKKSPAFMKLKLDAIKFALERLNKDKYSARREDRLVDEEGNDILKGIPDELRTELARRAIERRGDKTNA